MVEYIVEGRQRPNPPVQVNALTLLINGRPVNALDTGGDGEAVLLLHGWAAPMTLYQSIIDRLAQKGYRVVSFDMPGVGQTPEPEAPLTVQDYVALTLAVCREMNVSSCIPLAHSHGGRIALSLLGGPDCPIEIKKAVLIGATGVVPPKPSGVKLRQMGYRAAKALGTAPLTRPIFGTMYEALRDKRASADYKAASPVMRRTMNNVLSADFTHLMPGIRAQVLLIWGELDTATPLDRGRTMESLIPGAGLAVIRGAGHFCFADNWPQFSAVLDAFL